eukprot:4091665-Pyramimonas_sp.AAC.1
MRARRTGRGSDSRPLRCSEIRWARRLSAPSAAPAHRPMRTRRNGRGSGSRPLRCPEIFRGAHHQLLQLPDHACEEDWQG